MKLGYNTGYWSAGPPAGAAEAVKQADALGYDSLWTAEAYGSDALTPLAWWGAQTERIRLGTGIVQISARTPAATAMAAVTLDHLSNGRAFMSICLGETAPMPAGVIGAGAGPSGEIAVGDVAPAGCVISGL